MVYLLLTHRQYSKRYSSNRSPTKMLTLYSTLVAEQRVWMSRASSATRYLSQCSPQPNGQPSYTSSYEDKQKLKYELHRLHRIGTLSWSSVTVRINLAIQQYRIMCVLELTMCMLRGGRGSKSTCSSHCPTSPLLHEVAVLFPTPEHEQTKYAVNRVAKLRLY